MLRFYAFKGKSFLSRLIRFWTRGEYSHIAIEIENKLIEAWKHGKKLCWGYSDLTNHTPKTPYEIWELPLTPEEEDFCRIFYKSLADTSASYDLRGVFGFVFKVTEGDKRKWFCSEGAIYPLVVLRDWNKIKPWRVSPTRFIEIIQAAGGKCVETGIT